MDPCPSLSPPDSVLDELRQGHEKMKELKELVRAVRPKGLVHEVRRIILRGSQKDKKKEKKAPEIMTVGEALATSNSGEFESANGQTEEATAAHKEPGLRQPVTPKDEELKRRENTEEVKVLPSDKETAAFILDFCHGRTENHFLNAHRQPWMWRSCSKTILNRQAQLQV